MVVSVLFINFAFVYYNKIDIMLKTVFLVAAGGAVGSVCRMLASRWIQTAVGNGFPWGTMAVNVLGCFLIGLISTWAAQGTGISAGMKALLTVGFCGGFTTFSTFSNESLNLLHQGHVLQCALYAGGSVAIGILAAAAGGWVVQCYLHNA